MRSANPKLAEVYSLQNFLVFDGKPLSLSEAALSFSHQSRFVLATQYQKVLIQCQNLDLIICVYIQTNILYAYTCILSVGANTMLVQDMIF